MYFFVVSRGFANNHW